MPSIIAENDEVLVLDKPAGLIVHSDGRTVEPSVAEWIAEHYPTLREVGEPWVSPQGESVRVCGLVHRLDRTTSGVLVAAKTNEVYSYLKGEFRARKVEKVYRALVYGLIVQTKSAQPQTETGSIIAEIARTSERPRKWYARPCQESDVRAAITEWRVLRAFETEGEHVSYIELKPKTGRTHQLRVHLAFIGHSIIADPLYAPDKPSLLGFTRPALHAYSISFVRNGERQTFTASLPRDFEYALSRV